jgi:hypothetical protein
MGLNIAGILEIIELHWNIFYQTCSVCGPQATFGPWDVADWPRNGLYCWLTEFPVVSSNLPFGYSLQYSWIVLKHIVSTSFDVTYV